MYSIYSTYTTPRCSFLSTERKDFRIFLIFFVATMTMAIRMRLVRCSLLDIGLILLSLQSATIFALARLQAAVILPHGDFAVDPSLVPANTKEREAADAVAQAAAETGHWLSHHVDPDLIFLSTSHGIALSIDFGIYLGSKASGSADIGKDLHNASHASYRVHLPTITLDPRLSQQLVEEMIALQQNVSVIRVSADDSVDVPLQWAEVIPLMLIPPRQKQSQSPSSPSSLLRQRRLNDAVSTTSTQPRRHLILSLPLRRYTHATDMVSELVALGRMLRKWIDARPERVAVVISGDMSHTHRPDGPYGYSEMSAVFDAAVGRWAADPCHQAHSLLEEARSLQPEVLSCGFTGMMLLHGMLCSGDEDEDDDSMDDSSGNEDHGFDDPTAWDAHVRANRNVTYYGMMVASYERVTN
jgi:aromatic ring-opening dioxygenase LigB subunit